MMSGVGRLTVGGCQKLLMSSPRHLTSISPSASHFTRQMSTDTGSLAARLSSSALLRNQGLIGGKWVDAYDNKTIQVRNPATGDVITDVACMGGRETIDAIASAYDAYHSWSKHTASERSKYLRKWYDNLTCPN
uniref:Aldehyde dehydrogenase domain-containing protein n=1 Tax=Kalanchoe fedtschenkoi TaxID=63787 RepID=A0A7N0TPN6_KALFE